MSRVRKLVQRLVNDLFWSRLSKLITIPDWREQLIIAGGSLHYLFYYLSLLLIIEKFSIRLSEAKENTTSTLPLLWIICQKTLTVHCSWDHLYEPNEVKKKSFDLGGNLTHDLRIRSTVTLPTELRGRTEKVGDDRIPTEVKRFFLYLVWLPDSLY